MSSEQYALGSHIVVWGVTGSGKTTLSRHLGAILNLPVIELDAIAHSGGWNSTPLDEFAAELTDRLDHCPSGWVIEGSYAAIHHVYLPRADTLVWINLPWRMSFWRLLKRTVTRSVTGEEVYAGSPARESLHKAFLSRDSILWWGLSHHRAAQRGRARRTAELRDRLKVIEIRSAKQAEALMQSAARAEGQAMTS